MKKSILTSILCFVLISSVACDIADSNRYLESENNTNSSTSEENTNDTEDTLQESENTEQMLINQTYQLNKISDKYKCIGRVLTSGTGIWCDFSASGIAFNAYCKGNIELSVNCTLASKAYNKTLGNTYFTVFVDGVRQEKRYSVGKGESTLIIELPDEPAMREIRILKQNESVYSLCEMRTLSMCGYIDSAVEEREHYIEFIGDSITCGYGNLWVSEGDHNSAEFEDATSAFSFLTAEKLSADASLVSRGGIGVINGWEDPYNIKTLYQKYNYYRLDTAYNFANACTPDLIVINLGTNDFTKGTATESEFKAAVKELIEFIRSSYNSDIPIVWVHNMMGSCRAEWTKAVIDQLGGENSGLYMFEATENRVGGGGHPELTAHEQTAQTLSAFIKQKNILK